jgi:hypothetical protein
LNLLYMTVPRNEGGGGWRGEKNASRKDFLIFITLNEIWIT